MGNFFGPLVAAVLTLAWDFRVATSIYGVCFLVIGIFYWTMEGKCITTNSQNESEEEQQRLI